MCMENEIKVLIKSFYRVIMPDFVTPNNSYKDWLLGAFKRSYEITEEDQIYIEEFHSMWESIKKSKFPYLND